MTTPATDRNKVAILVNPHAGSGKRARLVEQLQRALVRRRLEPFLFHEREALSEAVERTDPEEWRCAVAAGGDGTLLEVVNRARGVPVSILPLGNENLVAKYCGLTRSGVVLAETIAEGRLFRTDLAEINGRIFSVMAGVGVDAEVVHRVHRKRRGHIGKHSYIVPTFQTLSYYRYPTLEVEIPETGERLRGAMLFVFNIPQYALNLPVAQGAAPNDGKLDLYLFRRPGLWNVARYLWAIFRGKHVHLPDHEHRVVERVRITSEKEAPVQTDGDPAGMLPAEIRVLPGAMTLLVPRQGMPHTSEPRT